MAEEDKRVPVTVVRARLSSRDRRLPPLPHAARAHGCTPPSDHRNHTAPTTPPPHHPPHS
jgi:hypothetical protein